MSPVHHAPLAGLAAGRPSSDAWVVHQMRGGTIEAMHPIVAALVHADGRLLDFVGDPRTVTTWRSAAKPFQLEASLDVLRAHGLAASLELTDLAIGAASHSAQPAHVQRVESLWSRLDLDETCLYCGGHWPVHEPSRQALVAAGLPCGAIHNNCSGKHTFMAAASRCLRASADYRAVEHPLQVAIADRVAERIGHPPQAASVVDGCGVPCFSLSIESMARAWAALARQWSEGPDATPTSGSSLAAVARAMHAEPWMVSGDGRLDLDLAQKASAPVITKVGAAGLLCGAFGDGAGFAIKVLSGCDAARPAAVAALANRWRPGLWSDDAFAPHTRVRNVVGQVVGGYVVVSEPAAKALDDSAPK